MNDFGCFPTGTSTYDCSQVIINAGRIAYAPGLINQSVLLTARLRIPDGARLTEVTCHFFDNSVTLDGSFRILARPLTSPGPGWMVYTNAISTTSTSTSIQALDASSNPTSNWGTTGPVANGNLAFFVSVILRDADGTGSISTIFLNGCSYQYEVSGF